MQLATFTPLFGSPRGEAGPWWRVQSPRAKVLACTPLSAFWFEGICWLAWRFDQRVPSTGAIVGCECALCQGLDLDVKQDVFPRLFDPGSWGLQVLINLVIVGVCLSLSSSKVNDHHRRQTQQPSGRTATQSRCFCYWAEWYQAREVDFVCWIANYWQLAGLVLRFHYLVSVAFGSRSTAIIIPIKSFLKIKVYGMSLVLESKVFGQVPTQRRYDYTWIVLERG